MFKLNLSETYFWPVNFELPGESGQFEKHNFEAQFRRLPQSRIDELRDQVQEGKIADKAIAVEVLAGWRDVVDGEGNNVGYSNVMRDRLLEVPGLATAIVLSYTDSLNGARRKN